MSDPIGDWAPRGDGRSAACELHVVPGRAEAGRDLVAVVALDLDGAVLAGAACTAEALQVGRHRLRVARGSPRTSVTVLPRRPPV